jgi:hypothetical protein
MAPWGLIGAVALAAGVETGVARLRPVLETEWAADRRATLERAGTRVAGCGVLVLGDSQLKFGVLPSLLERTTGLTTATLAVHGGHPAECLALLRRAIHTGARPRAVVVGFHPHLLAEAPETRLRPFAEVLGPVEAVDVAWTARDPALAAALLMRQALPSFRDRLEIRAGALDALGGKAVGLRQKLVVRERNWAVNRGAQVIPSVRFFRFFAESLRDSNATWRPDPVAAAYAGRLLDLAGREQITVFFVLSPFHPDVQEDFERTGLDRRFGTFVDGLTRGRRGVVVVDARRGGCDISALIDPSHLNRRGAGWLTRGLGAAIRAELSRPGAGPRAVELPPYQQLSKGETDDGAEDLTGSALAVGRPDAPLY